MACIERRPRCGSAGAGEPVPAPLSAISAIVTAIGGIFTIIITAAGLSGAFSVRDGILIILGDVDPVTGAITGGFPLTAGAVGAIGATMAALAVIGIVASYALDRCNEGEGLPECIAGVVQGIVRSFSLRSDDALLHQLLPFTATHHRVDVVVRSRYWNVLESGSAFVYCTEQEIPRRSEIMRCYYYDPRVCASARGALVGAGIGGIGGIFAGAAIGAAIGCATIFLCLLALILAALVAAALALLGAIAGGYIGRTLAENDTPTALAGETIEMGDYITVKGNMLRREEDDGANVIWWEDTTFLHGSASDGLPRQPFSYCDVDDELNIDSCPIPPPGVI